MGSDMGGMEMFSGRALGEVIVILIVLVAIILGLATAITG